MFNISERRDVVAPASMAAKEGASFLARLIQSNPLATNCVVMSSLSGLAELTQQSILLRARRAPKDDCKRVDWVSVGKYSFLGAVLFAPMLTMWYRWLDRKMPGTGARLVAAKVVVDAVVLDVPFYSAFYVAMGALDGKSLSMAVQELKEKLPQTIGYSLALWIPTQVVNFRMVAPRWRVVFMSGVTFLDINMMAMMKRKPVLGGDGRPGGRVGESDD